MNIAVAEAFKWAQGVLGEPTSRVGSYARTGGMLVIAGTLILVFFSTAFQRDIPPMAQAVLITLIGAVLGNYAVNKLSTTKKQDAPTAVPETKPVVPAVVPETTKEVPAAVVPAVVVSVTDSATETK